MYNHDLSVQIERIKQEQIAYREFVRDRVAKMLTGARFVEIRDRSLVFLSQDGEEFLIKACFDTDAYLSVAEMDID